MKEKKIDWIITLVPLAIIVALCILFFDIDIYSRLEVWRYCSWRAG